MTPGRRHWRYFFTACLVTAAMFNGVARAGIVPLRATATFSAGSPENRWSVPIKSSDGRLAYVLSLEPDFDVGHRVVTLELTLRRPDEKANSPNLLDPTGRRHGLQAYDFAADDLAHGAQRSVFGARRMVSLKNLGLVLRVVISGARVTPISTGRYQFNALVLQISVESSTRTGTR